MIIRKCDVCDISVGDEFLCVSPRVLSKHFRTKEKKKLAIFQSRCFLTESDVFIAAINKTLAGSLLFFFHLICRNASRAPRSVNLKCPTLRWRCSHRGLEPKGWPWCYLLLSVLLKSRLCCLICTEPSITFMPLVVNKAILNLSRVMQSQTLSARLSCVDVGHWSVCVWEKVNKTLGHRLSSLWEFFLLTCCSE